MIKYGFSRLVPASSERFYHAAGVNAGTVLRHAEQQLSIAYLVIFEQSSILLTELATI